MLVKEAASYLKNRSHSSVKSVSVYDQYNNNIFVYCHGMQMFRRQYKVDGRNRYEYMNEENFIKSQNYIDEMTEI